MEPFAIEIDNALAAFHDRFKEKLLVIMTLI